MEVPSAYVEFLATLAPTKPKAELYPLIGLQKQDRYDFVKLADRVGRRADTLEFAHVAFPRARMAPELFEASASRLVETTDDQIILEHLYIERRLTPLTQTGKWKPDRDRDDEPGRSRCRLRERSRCRGRGGGSGARRPRRHPRSADLPCPRDERHIHFDQAGCSELGRTAAESVVELTGIGITTPRESVLTVSGGVLRGIPTRRARAIRSATASAAATARRRISS